MEFKFRAHCGADHFLAIVSRAGREVHILMEIPIYSSSRFSIKFM